MLHSQGSHVFPQFTIEEVISAGPNAVVRNLGEKLRRDRVWADFKAMCKFIEKKNDKGELAVGHAIDEHMGWSNATRYRFMRAGKINKYIHTFMGPYGGTEVLQMPE